MQDEDAAGGSIALSNLSQDEDAAGGSVAQAGFSTGQWWLAGGARQHPNGADALLLSEGLVRPRKRPQLPVGFGFGIDTL